MVADGRIDAGVVLRHDGRPLDDLVGEGPAPVVVLTHPVRRVAGSILAGTVQRVYFAALPDASLRGVVTLVDALLVELTAEQRRSLRRSSTKSPLVPRVRAALATIPPPSTALLKRRRHPARTAPSIRWRTTPARSLRSSCYCRRSTPPHLSTTMSLPGLWSVCWLGLRASVRWSTAAWSSWCRRAACRPSSSLPPRGPRSVWRSLATCCRGPLVTVALALSSAGLTLAIATLATTTRQAHAASTS